MSKFFTAAVISIVTFIVIFPAITEAGCLLDPNGPNCNISIYTSYQPMINWPGVTQQGGTTGAGTFASYATAIYSVAIVIAALLAVIRLVIAGVKYMTTDVVSSKGEARNDIIGSLLGLLIIISAVVILQTINPNLTTITIAQPGGPISGQGLNPFITWSPTVQSQACNAPGLQCVTTPCPFWRTQLTCQGWCNALGGTTNGSLVGNGVRGATGLPGATGAVTCTHAVDPNDPTSMAAAQAIAETINIANSGNLPANAPPINPATDRAVYCANAIVNNWLNTSGTCNNQQTACSSGNMLPGGTAGTPTVYNIGSVRTGFILVCTP